MGFVDDVEVVTDLRPMSWIGPRLLPWGADQGTRAGSFVPTGFDAYARVLHPVEAHEGSQVSWREVAERTGRRPHARMQWEAITHPTATGTAVELPPPPVGELPQRQAEALVEILRSHTQREERCWFAVWEGYGDLPDTDAPRLQLPGRAYVLLTGPLEMAARPLWWSGSTPEHQRYQCPNLWLPDDQSWVVATEIDFAWTYVAGSASCIEAVLADERLESYEASVEDRADILGDDLNPLPPQLTERA